VLKLTTAHDLGARNVHVCSTCRAPFEFESSLASHRYLHTPDELVSAWERAVVAAGTDPLLRASEFLPRVEFGTAAERPRGVSDDILVVGPFWVDTLLRDYSVVEPLHYDFVDAFELVDESTVAKSVAEVMGLSVRTVLVIHSYPSFGFFLHGRKWNVAYSGDSRPCEELAQALRSLSRSQPRVPTLLIHESNFGDGMREKAARDRHSTLSEAISVGRAGGVDMLLLTHFGRRIKQRFPKLPPAESGDAGMVVSAAFDCMRVTPAQVAPGEDNRRFWSSFNAHCAAEFGVGIDEEETL
jgi:hypothetical protein